MRLYGAVASYIRCSSASNVIMTVKVYETCVILSDTSIPMQAFTQIKSEANKKRGSKSRLLNFRHLESSNLWASKTMHSDSDALRIVRIRMALYFCMK